MADLLVSLEKRHLLDAYAGVIDWYLNGKFFLPRTRWDKNRKTLFTRKIKTRLGIPVDQSLPLDFDPISHKSKHIKFAYKCGNIEGENFLKHIRNSIAHGNCQLYFPKGTPFIEILDYIDENVDKQTAYMYMPLENLKRIKETYEEIVGGKKKK